MTKFIDLFGGHTCIVDEREISQKYQIENPDFLSSCKLAPFSSFILPLSFLKSQPSKMGSNTSSKSTDSSCEKCSLPGNFQLPYKYVEYLVDDFFELMFFFYVFHLFCVYVVLL
jgi:hypothetical protein